MTTGPLELIRGALQGNHVRWVLSHTATFSHGGKAQPVNVLFNVTQGYAREWPGSVMDRPIEDGTTVTDHVKLDPQRVDFTILLTPEARGLTLATLLETDVDKRAEKLIEWRNGVNILTLTGKDVIENLVIESLTERKASDLRDSRMFDIVLRQVTIADTDFASEAGLGTAELQNEETPV